MTSRRSRLKAVTNLPVRRKTLPGNANEAPLLDNSSSEKIYSCGSNTDGTIVESCNTQLVDGAEKNVDEEPNKNNENEHVLVVNGAGDFQNNTILLSDNIISKTDELNNLETLGNTSCITEACNFLIYKTDNCNGSAFNSNLCFKSNLVSTSTENRFEDKTIEKDQEKEIPQGQICVAANNCNNYNNIKNINNNSNNIISNNNNNNSNNIISNNNNNNSNNSQNDYDKNDSSIIQNNIVEDGFKCYTVLTPQSITLNSLAEYTLTPLTPCVNTYIDTSVNDVSPLQEFEEVQIYSEVGPAELYINNSVEDCESEIESESIEPILTNLTNCTPEESINNVNTESLNSNVEVLKNVSKNFISKATIKNKSLSSKTSFIGKDELSINVVSQARNLHITENTGSLTSQNIFSDFNSLKQGISTFRRKKSKFNDFTKKLADAKKEFQKKYEKTKPDRSTLKMIDLIFYNPATNPMESKAKFEKKDNVAAPASDVSNELLAEEKVDEPDLLDCSSRSNLSDNCESDSLNQMPVPQVKIGLDGEIILDEKSLIIETTDVKKGREGLQNSVTIIDDNECKVSYYRGKSKKTRDWADFETKRFYKALNTIGPDFTLMQKYFPKRSRLELKNKFKREERMNRNLIDRALNNPSEFDMTQLEKDLAVEKEAEEGEIEMRSCKILKQTAKRPKIKSSLLSREMNEPDGESQSNVSKSLDGNSKKLSENEKNKKEKEFDFVIQKLLMKESEKLQAKLPKISTTLSTFKDPNHGVT